MQVNVIVAVLSKNQVKMQFALNFTCARQRSNLRKKKKESKYGSRQSVRQEIKAESWRGNVDKQLLIAWKQMGSERESQHPGPHPRIHQLLL